MRKTTNRMDRRSWTRRVSRVAVAACTTSVLASATPFSRVAAEAGESAVPKKVVIRNEDGKPLPILAMDASESRGTLCVAAADNQLRFFDANSLRLIKTAAAHRDRVRCVRYSPTGNRLASVAHDGRLLIWDTRAAMSISQTLEGTPALACADFDASGEQLVAGGFGPRLYRLHADGSDRIECDHGDLRAITHIEGRIVAGGRNGWLHAFENGREILERKINPGSINSIIALEGTLRVVSVCDDGCVIVYDLLDDQILHRIDLGVGRLFSVVSISSDQIAVAGSDDCIRIVDLTEERTVARLTGHSGSVSSLVMHRGTLISAGYDATIRIWDLSSVLHRTERVAEVPTTDGESTTQR